MDAPYDVQTYLLDRANIQDTVVRTMHLFDTVATAEAVNSVYTTEIYLDYEQLLGFSAEVVSSETWAKRLNQIHEPYDETQHIIHNLLIDLPQPTGNNVPACPDRCQAFAYAQGLFYNRDADKQPCLMVKRQGGKYRLELVKLKNLEEKGENPWRINKQEVKLSWKDKGVQ